MAGTKFIEEVVQSHNDYRRLHQVPPLQHSRELSDIAQGWAEQLARANGFQHSQSKHDGQPLGENISLKWSSRPDSYSGKDVSDQWYEEIKMYQFGGEPRSTNCGHFTQMVWKDSREIGVGKAQTSDGKTIVVANYKPAGNFLGRFSQNVLPPKGGIIPSQSNGRDSPHRSFRDSGFPGESRLNNSNMSASRSEAGQSRSVRTYTTTEGFGPNAVTKTVVEETITYPDGRKVTNKKETVTNGKSGSTTSGSSGRSMDRGFGDFDNEFSNRFERLGFGDRSGNGFSSGFGERSGNGFSSGFSNRSDSGFSSGFGDRSAKGQNSGMGNDPRFGSNGSSNTSPSTPQTMAEFTKACLASHNEKRAKHGVPSLTHSQQLTDFAQKWAEHIASSGRFGHSDCTLSNGDRLGENIACKWSSGGDDYTGAQVTDQWYSEIKKMDFNHVGHSSGTGHFTQVVWKGSRELGVGKARGRDGKVFVVASYRPAGNMMGEYQQNVFPPKH